MTMLNNKIYYIFILIIVFACNQNKDAKNIKQTTAENFDITKLVAEDIHNNQLENKKAKKTITINDKQETQIQDSVDWSKTLDVLLECDINKENIKHLYTQNYIHELDSVAVEMYNATSTKTPIKSMYIYRKRNETEKIIIHKEIKNLIFSSEQDIEYIPTKLLKIKATQHAIFMQDFKSNIEISFL